MIELPKQRLSFSLHVDIDATVAIDILPHGGDWSEGSVLGTTPSKLSDRPM